MPVKTIPRPDLPGATVLSAMELNRLPLEPRESDARTRPEAASGASDSISPTADGRP